MNTLESKVRERIEMLGISMAEASARSGLEVSFIKQLLNGRKRTVRNDNLEKLAKGLGTTPQWLLGAMEITESGNTAAAETSLGKPFKDAIPQARATMGAGSTGAPFFHVATLPTGETIDVDQVEDWWRVPLSVFQQMPRTNRGSLVIFPMDGDSMEPTILRTDYVFIDSSRRRLEADGIWAVDYGLGITLKRMQIERGEGDPQFILKSDNPLYPDIRASESELTIVGRYVGRFTVY